MDDINDFFDFSKPFNRVNLPNGYVNGRVVEDRSYFNQMPEREHVGKEYAEKLQRDEERQLMTAFAPQAGPSTSYHSNMEDVEDESMVDENEDEAHIRKLKAQEMMNEVFEKYNFSIKSNNLTIQSSRKTIIKAINDNSVIVLKGATGCGKTTQVPQFILDDCYSKKEYCNIIVTQPRKIAAISVAKRVANERKCEVGSLVGYKVGLKEELGADTRILYVTTGVLLQSLVNSKTMANYTHVILDEVHDREIDMDFLLIVVRRFLSTHSKHVKIIMMSATIEAKEFSEYFKIPKPFGKGYLPAPVFDVEHQRQFSVNEYYFDDLDKLKPSFKIEYENPGICDEMYMIAAKLVLVCDRLIDEIERDNRNIDCKPSVLIFLPGINEINQMSDHLEKGSHYFGDGKGCIQILKLHSSISNEEQARVFKKPAPNQRKVILSTNIAESSITVPDIKFVIDFCLSRVLHTDTATNFTSLRTEWASRSSCIQRAGRTGRVMNGRVYRLVDRRFFENEMTETSSPELLRCPLQNVVLKAKILDMGAPQLILGLAMNPPNLSDIRNTVLLLKEIGAMMKTTKGKYDILDGDLTYFGLIMAQLPVDLRISKLIILGHIFSVLDEAIIIGAGMNVKNIFLNQNNIKGYAKKLHWADGSGSDCIAVHNAYIGWKAHCEQFDEATVKSWAERMSLETKSLREMAELYHEIKERLEKTGLKEVRGPNRVIWTAKEKSVILKIIISGAFYPNYFLPMSGSDSEFHEHESVKILGGRDPRNTVFFTGFEHEKLIGSLYKRSFLNIMNDGLGRADPNMKITFEKGTNKVYITFIDNRTGDDYHESFMPGKIHPDVYKAVKMRRFNATHYVKVMSHKEAIEFAQGSGLGIWDAGYGWIPRKRCFKNAQLSVIPSFYKECLVAEVSHIEHCYKFYVRPMDSSNREIFTQIQAQLNDPSIQLTAFEDDFHDIGMMVAAPFKEGEYSRAVLRSYKNSESYGGVVWTVYFIDYGNTKVIGSMEFRKLDGRLANLKDIPPRIFECALAEVQPSAFDSPKGSWTIETINKFKELVLDKTLIVDVYSIVNGIANVFLKKGETNFNEVLVKLKFAQFSEESYMSKMDHDTRLRKQNQTNAPYDDLEIMDQHLEHYIENNEVEVMPPEDKCRATCKLSGPYSPLEIKASSTMRYGIYKSVQIENESVNSVLLDSDPQDSHEKLLVAGCITNSDNKLMLRQTTFMPNIPGFPALMALIFCPTSQINKDDEGTRGATILTGLGFHEETGQSLFPEHDIMLNLDFVLTNDDISTINTIRYTMDTIMYMDPDKNTPKIGNVSMEQLKIKIKNLIIKLLATEREFMEVQNTLHDFTWKNNLTPATKKKKEDRNIYESAIYPLHEPLSLIPKNAKQNELLKKHCRELHRLAVVEQQLPKSGFKCDLCNQSLLNNSQLRIHLHSKLHRDRESQIKYFVGPNQV